MQRIDEIGGAHAFHRGADIVDLEQVADDDLDAFGAQRCGALVVLADQRADRDGRSSSASIA